MSTQARKQRYVVAEKQRAILLDELAQARARLAQARLEVLEDEAYCQDLQRMLGCNSGVTFLDLPRNVIRHVIRSRLSPLEALSLSFSCKKMHEMCHRMVVRTLRRFYDLGEATRLEYSEPLVPALRVSFVLRPLVQQPTTGPRCFRCGVQGHEALQCVLPCRHCGHCGHTERRCAKRKYM